MFAPTERVLADRNSHSFTTWVRGTSSIDRRPWFENQIAVFIPILAVRQFSPSITDEQTNQHERRGRGGVKDERGEGEERWRAVEGNDNQGINHEGKFNVEIN